MRYFPISMEHKYQTDLLDLWEGKDYTGDRKIYIRREGVYLTVVVLFLGLSIQNTMYGYTERDIKVSISSNMLQILAKDVVIATMYGESIKDHNESWTPQFKTNSMKYILECPY